jgi:hypothetical protein
MALQLARGVPVKVVSERLSHTSATIALSVYAHLMPGNQRAAAELFASLVYSPLDRARRAAVLWQRS